MMSIDREQSRGVGTQSCVSIITANAANTELSLSLSCMMRENVAFLARDFTKDRQVTAVAWSSAPCCCDSCFKIIVANIIIKIEFSR